MKRNLSEFPTHFSIRTRSSHTRSPQSSSLAIVFIPWRQRLMSAPIYTKQIQHLHSVVIELFCAKSSNKSIKAFRYNPTVRCCLDVVSTLIRTYKKCHHLSIPHEHMQAKRGKRIWSYSNWLQRLDKWILISTYFILNKYYQYCESFSFPYFLVLNIIAMVKNPFVLYILRSIRKFVLISLLNAIKSARTKC